jgi:hypothetical protein
MEQFGENQKVEFSLNQKWKPGQPKLMKEDFLIGSKKRKTFINVKKNDRVSSENFIQKIFSSNFRQPIERDHFLDILYIK